MKTEETSPVILSSEEKTLIQLQIKNSSQIYQKSEATG